MSKQQFILSQNENSFILLDEDKQGHRFIRKVANPDKRSDDKLLRFKNEYEYTHNLRINSVRKAISLENYEDKYSLTLEYIDGDSLYECFVKKSNSLDLLIEIFYESANSLDEIHRLGIIHKEINSHNILWNHRDKQIVFIDFEMASKFDTQVNAFVAFEEGKNSLPYIAPEQTGRLNRKVDFRSDLYSLGITFFELFTGKLPYESDDTLELIHFHLAKEIPSAHQWNPQVPEMISAIIKKLMAKNAEDRYQSAYGLMNDLFRSKSDYATSRTITNFTLGQEDNRGKLLIPQKLYGREEELAQLLVCFNRVCKGSSELLLVDGYSGIGKTALISELYKPVTEKKAYFISGKHEQYQRSSPYFAIIQALTEFCNRLLTESKEKLDQWRKNIVLQIGEQGKVLTDLIPALEKIIGPQPEIEKLENQESLFRLKLLFHYFIKSICNAEHPLVLFVDDLQWADSESINLLRTLLTESKIPHLLIIGAYRDNEVSAGHPLLNMLETAAIENATINSIKLKPLNESHVYQLISETLQSVNPEISKLTDLIYSKTLGNAFFTLEFLKSLYKDGDLRYSIDDKKWTIDFARINQRKISNNVVDLLIYKLNQLSPESQQLLSKAACIGSKFDVTLLLRLLNKNAAEIRSYFEIPIHEHYIIPLSDRFEFIGDGIGEQSSRIEFSFAHDRVQQACYSLESNEQQQKTHFEIAKILESQQDEKQELFFEKVHHYNAARALIQNEQDKLSLIKLNILAGKEANNSGSFNSAQTYIEVAQELSPDTIWELDFETAHELNKLNAEIEYLNGKFTQSEERLKLCLDKVTNPNDKSKLYFLLTQNYATQGHYTDAISAIRQGLKELGFMLPLNSEAEQYIPGELTKILTYFNTKGIETIYDFPFLDDDTDKSIMLLLDNGSPNTYVSGESQLWTLHVLNKINFTIEHGMTFEGIYAFTEVAIIFNILNMFEVGEACTNLAFRLSEKYKKESLRHYSRTGHIHMNYNMPYFWHIRNTHNANPRFYQLCLESGELVFAGYISMYLILNCYYWGKDPLSKISPRIPDTLEFLNRIKHNLGYGSIEAYEMISSFLEGKTKLEKPFETNRLKPEDFLARYQGVNLYAITMWHLMLTDINVLMGEQEDALKNVLIVEQLKAMVTGNAMQDAMYRSLHALILIKQLKLKGERDLETIEKIITFKDQFEKWNAITPANFAHRHYLIRAEWHSLHNETKEALKNYQLALSAATENEYNRDVAMIHYYLGEFWLTEENLTYATYHFEKAIHQYIEFDYVRPAEYLINRLESYDSLTSLRLKTKYSHREESGSLVIDQLDVQSILKASNTLSEEIVFENLIEKLLKIVNENIGGQRALLLIPQHNSWMVTAEYNLNEDNNIQMLNTNIQDYKNIPLSVIYYMVRTPQIINNSMTQYTKVFDQDPYVVKNKHINFVALPLIYKGILNGIIYVENSIDSGAISSSRLETMNLLSSQMAVSLENANLYKRQFELNKAYQRFVPHSFLETLGHSDILDVKLGDCIDQDMTVMFCDIRSYTTLAENMRAKENFNFINSFLQALLPGIREHQGFINHFLGDGFIALFKSNPESAIQASEKMYDALKQLNESRKANGEVEISFGLGLHTGKVMLGIIGDQERTDANVLSDAVNLASRLEGLTRVFNTTGIVSQETYELVKSNPYMKFRFLGKVKVKGRNEGLGIYEILNIESGEAFNKKLQSLEFYNQGLDDYFQKRFTEAAMNLRKTLDINPNDISAKRYLQLSAKYMVDGVGEDWSGVEGF